MFNPEWPHGHKTRDGRKARQIGACNDMVRPLVWVMECGCDPRSEMPFQATVSGGAVIPNWDVFDVPAPPSKARVKVDQVRVVIVDSGEGLLRRPCDPPHRGFASIHITGEIAEGATIELRLPPVDASAR